jgi:phosphocarrier protein
MSPRAARTVRIANDLGIHLRAAGALVQVAGRFRSELWLERSGTRANGKSIMSVLSLAAGRGVELEVIADGEDAEDAVAAVVDLIERGFEG